MRACRDIMFRVVVNVDLELYDVFSANSGRLRERTRTARSAALRRAGHEGEGEERERERE